MTNFFLTIAILFLSTPILVFAQGTTPVYTPLVNVFAAGQTRTFEAYINLLYITSISLAALLAVVKILIAGVKYMLSDVVTNKGEALKDIQGALLGLLLILGIYVILNTINPRLTNGGLKFEPINAPKAQPAAPGVQATPATPGGTPSGGTQTNLLPPLTIAGSGPASGRFMADCIRQGGRHSVSNGIMYCLSSTPASPSTPTPTNPATSATPSTPAPTPPIVPVVSCRPTISQSSQNGNTTYSIDVSGCSDVPDPDLDNLSPRVYYRNQLSAQCSPAVVTSVRQGIYTCTRRN